MHIINQRTNLMAKKLFFLIVLLISAQLISAQDYYIKGYIIKLNGDTIYGLINDLKWKYNPDTIEFRENPSSPVQKYTPNDIAEFKTKDIYYISYKNKLDLTPVRTEDLQEDGETVFLTVTTFLRLVNKGNVNLYEYHSTDPEKYIYLIQKGNENITELIYQKKRTIKNGEKIIQTNEFYKNQLEAYLIDCKEAVKLINKTSYNIQSLNKRINIYNTSGLENNTEHFDYSKNENKATGYFINGYIIKNRGDTIHGLINDLDWMYNPEIIEFKEDFSSPVQKYTPSDITEFKTKDNYYISYSGNLDLTPVRTEDLYEGLEIHYQKVTTFLRLTNKGKINLYEYCSAQPDKYIYLIQKGNGKITELIYQKKMYFKRGERTVQTNDFYKTQLESYLISCKDAVKSINNAKYNLSSISKRVTIFNKCNNQNILESENVPESENITEPEIILESENIPESDNITVSENLKESENIQEYEIPAKESKNKIRLSLLSGISVNNFSVHTTHIIDDNIQFEDPAVLFLPGIGFEYILPRSRESASLFINMTYNTFYKENIDVSEFFRYEYYFSSKHIKLAGGYKKYIFQNNNEFQPYIYAGVYTLLGGINYRVVSTHTVLGNSYTKTYEYAVPINFRIGCGLTIKEKIIIDFSYDYYLLKDDALKYRTINLLVGYSFKF